MSGYEGENLTANKARKVKYRKKLEALLRDYRKILVVNVEHVGSRQMQQVRMALRGQAILLMGKNTLIRKVVREEAEVNPKLEPFVPYVTGNVGFIFTNGNLNEIRDIVGANKVPAAARSGMFAPSDVFVPPGPTPMDPGQTKFFQALNIQTKISRGAIEILSKVHLIKAGERVTASATALLSKLGIKPFFFGMTAKTVYEDGSVYDAKVLDLSESDLLNKFYNGVNKIAALGLAIGIPNMATVPHSLARAFRKLVALGIEIDYIFEEAKPFKAFLDDPTAFAAAAPAAAAAEEEAAPAAAESESEEESEGEGFSLFD